MATETADRPKTRLSMADACELLGIGYTKLRSLAVDAGEFTVIRDGTGRGFRISLLRDEVEEYDRGGLPALRRFRIKKGRK